MAEIDVTVYRPTSFDQGSVHLCHSNLVFDNIVQILQRDANNPYPIFEKAVVIAEEY